MITDTNRFNGDPANRVYLQWNLGGAVVRERLPAAFGYAEDIRGLSDGRPIVWQELHDAGVENRLLARTGNGWKEYQRLPDGLNIIDDRWTIGPDDTTYVVTWQPSEQRVVLWRGVGDEWRGQVIVTAENLPVTPTMWSVHIDPKGQPVVVVGRTGEPFSWLKAYRRNAEIE